MYNWKELALMYREELETLHGEMEGCSTDLLSMGSKFAISALIERKLGQSASNVLHVQSFESVADRKPKKVNKANKKVNVTYELSSSQVQMIQDSCHDIYDPKKEPYNFVDKCAYLFAQVWMRQTYGKTLDVCGDELSKNVNNIFQVKRKGTSDSKNIKVVASGMKHKGKTKRFGSDEALVSVESQHTYLIDPKEDRADMYIFATYACREKKLTIQYQVGGKFIDELLVDPLRERFIGKKACILQERGYNNDVGYLRSISELIKRSK
jgi:hypothetical protein